MFIYFDNIWWDDEGRFTREDNEYLLDHDLYYFTSIKLSNKNKNNNNNNNNISYLPLKKK